MLALADMPAVPRHDRSGGSGDRRPAVRSGGRARARSDVATPRPHRSNAGPGRRAPGMVIAPVPRCPPCRTLASSSNSGAAPTRRRPAGSSMDGPGTRCRPRPRRRTGQSMHAEVPTGQPTGTALESRHGAPDADNTDFRAARARAVDGSPRCRPFGQARAQRPAVAPGGGLRRSRASAPRRSPTSRSCSRAVACGPPRTPDRTARDAAWRLDRL